VKGLRRLGSTFNVYLRTRWVNARKSAFMILDFFLENGGNFIDTYVVCITFSIAS
jgi:aryl-alcohol dehydrogenase-like predicted oxidoreductase